VLGNASVAPFDIQQAARFGVVTELVPEQMLERRSFLLPMLGKAKRNQLQCSYQKNGPEFVGAIFININEKRLG
jgi:hypothetical protein